MDVELFQNLNNGIEKLKSFDISGVRLECPEPGILVLDQDDFETHVLIQAPAITFYGWHLCRAEACVKQLKEDYDKWMKIKKSEAQAQIMGDDPDAYKPSESAKEARVFVNSRDLAKKTENGIDEDEDWRNKIRLAEEYRDTIKAWYDGFVAKNWLIKVYGNVLESDGRGLRKIDDKDAVFGKTSIKSRVQKSFNKI
ncbi:MAG: hypothetical protein M0P12_00645 [Paludibacteraceae bacterium]|nr:hypothetical protein [Paludibacteraceae bacterium]MCK9615605.1 hypothetical protein [Candidatus Omnitrophota bacterium]